MKYLLPWIPQPPGSNLCGQACVAMLAGVTLAESIQVFGTEGRTSWKQVRGALRHFGIVHRLPMRPRWMPGTPEPIRMIARLSFPDRNATHYAVRSFGYWYDPEKFNPIFPPGTFVVSYIEIL